MSPRPWLRIAATALLLSPVAVCQQPGPSVTWFNISLTGPTTTQPRFQATSVPVFGSGTVIATVSNLTGSPATCQWVVPFAGQNASSNATAVSSFQTVTFTPANGVSQFHGITTQFLNYFSAVGIEWNCGTYPTTGSANVEYIPDSPGIPMYTFSHITGNAANIIRGGAPANIHGISINQPGTGETITVFDNTTCTGNTIAIFTGFTVGQFLTLDVTTSIGLCVTTSGTTAGDYTVVYR